MVKINNQAVIQKLIDELRLYPGTGMIPTELADKILPVFQINSEVIEMSVTPTNVASASTTLSLNNTQTIYTVPATGKFFLTNISAYSAANATSADANELQTTIHVTPTDGVSSIIMRLIDTHKNATYGEPPVVGQMSLANPMELEPGSLITITAGLSRAWGSIVGYTSD